MASDNYFKVAKGTRIIGIHHFDSHDVKDVERAFKLACSTANGSGPRHKDEMTPRISIWHKRTIIMSEGPWAALPAVGQVLPPPKSLPN
jgi:hypothetical protein